MTRDNNTQMIEDILDIVNHIKDNAVTRDEFNELKSEFSGFSDKVGRLESKVTTISAIMVTKEYLDEKLADLRGDLVVLTRKEDVKLKALVDMLASKKILTPEETKRLMSMEPFPQLAL